MNKKPKDKQCVTANPAVPWVAGLLLIFLAGPGVNLASANLSRIHLFFSESMGSSTLPRESVRTELVRFEQEAGLTVGAYFKGLQIVSFENRHKYDGKSLVPTEDGDGIISPDGTRIALRVVRWEGRTRKLFLGIVRFDGSNLVEYPDIRPKDACWSRDQSKLLVTVSAEPNAKLGILSVDSKTLDIIDPLRVDQTSHLTSQCWSPNGEQIVYETGGNVQVYEFENRKSRILAKGTQPTWAPDGDSIAYRDGENYYVVRSSGEGRKELFRKARAVSGLYWSPDSRFVAYVHKDFFALDTEFYHLMVRRMEDNSEDAVADGVLCCVEYQWVANPQLLKLAESWATK